MRFDEVVRLLRQQERLRAQVAMVDAALEQLDECQREIIDKMVVNPERFASENLCEKFGIEVAAVYRRRNKGIQKLASLLPELR